MCSPSGKKQADVLELKKLLGASNAKGNAMLRSIPKCSNYHESNRAAFVRQCPKESAGCLTKFEGKFVSLCAGKKLAHLETAKKAA